MLFLSDMSRSPSFKVKEELSPSLDPESLQRWIVALCAIRFDLELGQLIEECYPPGCLTHDEELEIAYISHLKSKTSIATHSEITEVDKEFSPKPADKNSVSKRLSSTNSDNSVVILSHSPYSSVFKPLLQFVGPLYFDIGKIALELIAAYVSTWPAPVLGKLMDLPIGNALLKENLPPAHSLPKENGVSLDESAAPVAPFLPNNQYIPQGLFHDSDLYGAFHGLLLQLWLFWELLLGEPILIIAPTPPHVDFHPYFTIHDPQFAHLNSIREGETFPPMVLGVTILFFLKALHKIPYIVSVGSPPPSSNRVSLSTRSSTGKVSSRPEGLGLQQLSLQKFSPSSLLNAIKLWRDGPLCLMTEHKEAIWTTYSATTKPDTSILNRLIDAGMSPRRHFLELTINFLAPFGPYFRITAPLEGSSPYVDPPSLPPFNADEFLAILSARGPRKFILKQMKSNWLDFYRRFLNGPNFMPWFQRRRAVAEQKQDRLWRHARMKTDIQKLISKMAELEVVDSFSVIERLLLGELLLQQPGNGGIDSTVTCQKLMGDLQAVFSALTKDMQQLMLSNPQRASLLRGSPELTKLPALALVQAGGASSTSLT
ncbi:hypothetical protein GLYMA_05G013100v4 [Glycine max]|uniref:UDENN domain-containing protein n=1 Tax=Glycine max TaxID=3847 RepID=A0A0R0JPJ2_SOYBN|nr:hypothetical protein GLYMA_05G013100v4 [Glycine max]